MEEIKRRVRAVEISLGSTSQLPMMAVYEFGFLQIRKIIENFSLACLVAQGGIPGIHKTSLSGTYKADFIIKELEKLQPQFYPIASYQAEKDQFGKVIEVKNKETGFITKSQIIALYHKAAERLHVGSLQHVLSKQQVSLNFKDITEPLDKIIGLLNHHQIQTIEPDEQIWVIMNAEHDGRVHWSLMKQAPGPMPLHQTSSQVREIEADR
jgi:hypothetical protein